MADGNMDVSKIVSRIMENPGIIEQISALVKSSEEKGEVTETPDTDTEAISEPAVAIPPPTYRTSDKGSNRQRLLCAFKPYVSSERAKAIDSMISVAEILDLMKAR